VICPFVVLAGWGAMSGQVAIIRVGVGGWVYEPWRNNFHPAGLPQGQELAYAARQLGAIEVNSTFYSSQKARHIRKVARAGARRLRVLAEGFAPCHPSPRARRGR
jgi:hypothetical protein